MLGNIDPAPEDELKRGEVTRPEAYVLQLKGAGPSLGECPYEPVRIWLYQFA